MIFTGLMGLDGICSSCFLMPINRKNKQNVLKKTTTKKKTPKNNAVEITFL